MNGAYAHIVELLHHYHDGLHRCDTQLLAKVFHENAIYFTASGGEEICLDMATYLPKVAERTPPGSSDAPLHYHIESIELAGPVTAIARARSSMWGKDFIDILTLVRTEGQWKVISKVFHHEDNPGFEGEPSWN